MKITRTIKMQNYKCVVETEGENFERRTVTLPVAKKKDIEKWMNNYPGIIKWEPINEPLEEKYEMDILRFVNEATLLPNE